MNSSEIFHVIDSFRLRWTWSTSWRLSPSTSLSSWKALRTLRSSARLARSSGWSRWTSHHHYTDTFYWAHKLQFKLLTHVIGDADLESVSSCSSLCWTSVSLLYTPAGFWQSFTFLHIHFHFCHFHFHLCRSPVTVPHTQAGFWQSLTFTFLPCLLYLGVDNNLSWLIKYHSYCVSFIISLCDSGVQGAWPSLHPGCRCHPHLLQVAK